MVVELQRTTVVASTAAQPPSLETLRSPELAKVQHSLMILSSRIQDQQLRDLVMKIRVAAAQALMAASQYEAARPLKELAEASEAALERAGRMLIAIL